ncbi:MAG: hypothetical protein HN353_00610 [Bdellovibrionales bacterium]|nr:hypothetical protein [Bdellovibrionales bacterium]MBT3525640.1 hypothetical protein [Bdellovibrionales bacterium]MBT7668333.1 hypothetical protein [Bdellovibrionales bacterium]MBT7766318.1 hypothetical protein [Bdellovibrionales bacterium]
MGLQISILGLLLLTNALLFAADTNTEGGADGVAQVRDSLQLRDNSLMGKILEDEEMQQIVALCRNSNPDKLAEFQQCIEDEMAKPANASLIAKLQEKYLDKGDEKSKDRYQAVETASLKRTNSPAMKKLEEYLTKRLEDALYGEIKKANDKKKQRMVDHTTFFKLYEEQVSKNIIATVSSFCLNVCTSSPSYDPKSCREENLKALSVITQGKTQPEAYGGWMKCLENIPKFCSGTPSLGTDGKNHACQVTDALKGMRLNLLRLSAIDQRFKQIKSENKKTQFMQETEKNGRRERYTNETQGDSKSLDDLTTVTSNELINKSGYGKALEDESKKLQEECVDSYDEEKCKHYLHSDDDVAKLEDAATEHSIRRQVAINKIAQIKDEETLTTFLEEEGRSKDEIQKMLNESTASDKVADVVGKITEQFKGEKAAMIAALNKKIESRKVERASSNSPPVAELKKKKLTEVKKEMEAKPKGYQELVHFNNIISGFLTIEKTIDGKKESMANTHAMFRELEDNAYQSGREPGSANQPPSTNDYGATDLEKLKENLGKAGIEDEGAEANATKSMQIEDLNRAILKYK